MATSETFSVIRFFQDGERTVLHRGWTREQVMEWCNDPATSGDGWFDGWDFDYLWEAE